MKITSLLYQAARLARDVEVATSLEPKKIIRHFVINKFIMKKAGKFTEAWKGGGLH